ncbi:MAG TPA: MG2 domain-containing protein, partial [Pirellulales bacterium]|nr:MG2 domain-containing protein [Pirellulales bacterium]
MISPNEHVLEYVDAHVHGALSRDEDKAVAIHCRRCPICKVALEEAEKRLALLESVPPAAVSPELLARAEEQLAARRRPRFRRSQLVAFAALAAALLIACCHLYIAKSGVSPYDLRVLGQNELVADSDASLRVLLVNHDTLQPIAGMPVSIDLRGPEGTPAITLARGVTDRSGTIAPRIHVPAWKDGDYELQVSARAGFGSEHVAHKVKLHRDWQLMLSSDKPVYQPGQTIQLRALALRRPDLKPLAGREVVFSVADPKGNKIFRQRQVTSRFGIGFTACPLADEIAEGGYQIECQMGDTTSNLTVDVAKYVLPKFKLEVDSDRTYYEPGQKIVGTVRAAYFFGQAVQHGEVDVELRQPSVVEPLLATAHAQTDDAGKATFEIALPAALAGRPQEGGDAPIDLVVTARDTAGQQQATTLSRLVTANPIHIEVLPESGSLVRGVPNTIYLLTSYPDGQPATARLNISGIDHEIATNELGAASVVVEPAGDRLDWVVRASDAAGLSGHRQVELRSGPNQGDFLFRSDKAVYSSGETLRILTLGGGTQPVFFDFVRDGQTILTRSVEMAEGRGELVFDLPPELFGPIELLAYRYLPDGLPTRKSRLIYVRQAGSLVVDTRLDHAEYRPGERAMLNFTLTDAAGRPAPGALSLAAVDQAVFSVRRGQTGLSPVLSRLENELLAPVYAIYPWSADLRSQPTDKVPTVGDRNHFEQALFAAAARTRNPG